MAWHLNSLLSMKFFLGGYGCNTDDPETQPFPSMFGTIQWHEVPFDKNGCCHEIDCCSPEQKPCPSNNAGVALAENKEINRYTVGLVAGSSPQSNDHMIPSKLGWEGSTYGFDSILEKNIYCQQQLKKKTLIYVIYSIYIYICIIYMLAGLELQSPRIFLRAAGNLYFWCLEFWRIEQGLN